MTRILPVLSAGPAAAGTGAPTGPPTGAAYDIVLLLHVACVVVALGTVVVSGTQAARLLGVPPGAALPPTLARYYAPGVNWAGRTLYGVPILGVALLGMGHGAYGFGDAWVLAGLLLWVLGAVAAEVWLWPAERRIGSTLARPPAGGTSPFSPSDALRRDGRLSCAASAGVAVVLIGVSVLMVAQP